MRLCATAVSLRACLTACAALAGCGREPYSATGTVTTYDFDSSIVEDRYRIRIRTPPGPADASGCPLVIQLDPTFAGLRQYDTTVGLVSHFEDLEGGVGPRHRGRRRLPTRR